MPQPNPWYHGSPQQLGMLRKGSTITPSRDLARAFSHKPTLLCIADDGSIRHNGALPGYLYRVAEEIRPGDIYPHPRTTMGEGQEWLITRPLRVELIGPTVPMQEELLSPEECLALWNKATTKACS